MQRPFSMKAPARAASSQHHLSSQARADGLSASPFQQSKSLGFQGMHYKRSTSVSCMHATS